MALHASGDRMSSAMSCDTPPWRPEARSSQPAALVLDIAAKSLYVSFMNAANIID
jgi:hypothetical protein